MWHSIKDFIAGHIWPFSAYQRKVNILSDKIIDMEREQEEKEKDKVNLIKELQDKISFQSILDELIKHINELDIEKNRLVQKYEKLEEEKEQLFQKYYQIEEERDELKKEKEGLLQEYNQVQEEKDKLKEEGEQLLQNYNQEQEERNRLEEKYKLLESENKDINARCINLSDEIEHYKKEQIKENGLGIPSGEFWNEHYKNNGNSGTGSYHRLAEFKAEIVNQFITKEKIKSVIEIGCGDGNQLSLIHYNNYTGVDVSEVIVERNKKNYQNDNTKQFFCTKTEREKYINQKYDMSISMDVIFHLLEDQIFYDYMEDLFLLAERYVVIYSSNHEEYTKWSEYRHRNFISYIQEKISGWELYQYIPNRYPYKIGEEETTSASDFYIFKKK